MRWFFGAANRIRTGARSQLQIAPRFAKNRTLSPVFYTLRASSVCWRKPSTDFGHRFDIHMVTNKKETAINYRSFFVWSC